MEALNRRRARVAFSYQPQNEDELQLEVSDVIEVLEEVEEGWWKGVLKGRIGVFPSNFVVLEEAAPASPRAAATATANNQSRWGNSVTSDFHSEKPESSGDITGDHSLASLEIKPKPVAKGIGFGNILPESRIKIFFQRGCRLFRKKFKSLEALGPLKKPAPPVPSDTSTEAPKLPPKPVREQAKVLYAYEAQNDDELTIKEGDVITVLTKEVEDKGWWKGELNGRVGVFPDNFVKLIKEEVPQPVKPERPEKPPGGKMAGKPDLPDKPAFQEYGNSSDRPVSKVPPFKPSEISKKAPSSASVAVVEEKGKAPAPPPATCLAAAKKPFVLQSPPTSASPAPKKPLPQWPVQDADVPPPSSPPPLPPSSPTPTATPTSSPALPSVAPPLLAARKTEGQTKEAAAPAPVYAQVRRITANGVGNSRESQSSVASSSKEEYSEATFDSIEPSENKLNHPTANRVRPPMNRRPPSHITIVKENGNEPSEQQPAWMKDLGKRHQAKFSSQPTFEGKDTKIASSPEKELPSRVYPQKSPPSAHKPLAGSVREESAVLSRSPVAKEIPAVTAAPVILRSQKGLCSAEGDAVQELKNELKSLRENCVPKEELTSLQQQINSLKETVESNRNQYSKLVRDLMAEIDEEKKLRMTLQVEIDRLKKLTLTV
ncbi:SH3 domain-containing kinase-binding protein 1 isoform X2 [Dermacentor silvarum]|uniref:SH3 domain-containing kinase-binding protein 1 isoform X2 n=1 Tax=Dermacentor silvarum TaxID=543639 RepID=UPI0021010148|nr:SH3 domain-containing kinase-binding protein 1 isoform X2 [Dermacentor silvarum]